LKVPAELVVLSQGTQVKVLPLWITTLFGPQLQLKFVYSQVSTGETQLQLNASFLVVVKVPAVPHLKQSICGLLD
jgi:hypothetical protein